MPIDVRVPSLGESIVDATIASWLKKEGDTVRQGETLAELETDKVNVEVNADQDGVLQKVIKKVGDIVAVGEVLCVIGVSGESSESVGIASSSTVTEAEKTVASPSAEKVSVPAVQQTYANGQRNNGLSSDAQRPPSPLARRIASEHNVDIAQVRGSSPHGRVTKDDVIQYLTQQPEAIAPVLQAVAPVAPVAPAAAASQIPPTQSQRPVAPAAVVSDNLREERVRMSRRRQTIAQRLVEAQHTAAMLTTFNEIDMSAILDIRKRRKDAFKEKYGVSLGFMSFFTRAVIGALKAFPRLNAEIQGAELVLKHYYDIGIAVSTDEGLIVPVVRDADRKSFAQIEREVADLAKRARSNSLTLPELQGGTFTITNGGVFGSLLSTPILNGPQVGILGMHKIEERPIALNGQVVIRPMMYLALSYDHRIVDGSEAVRFLVTIKGLLEDPESLLLEG
ncbi:dihydrolipoyllysine-residue succinyltransferase component of 2-oxoglutarate dehydrogenase complex [Ktedonobacteria bacterium brp13]|nr:dihydrolipoyllysine-residue succinyltransferase component of 2-oxoglutarate dehydrogenase complex [Ktedonobacteria bacterium brp13]